MPLLVWGNIYSSPKLLSSILKAPTYKVEATDELTATWYATRHWVDTKQPQYMATRLVDVPPATRWHVVEVITKQNSYKLVGRLYLPLPDWVVHKLSEEATPCEVYS
jgi:hypothetical protein